jgi:hypothetical protein
MPYKDIQKNRTWHKNHMRTKRKLLKSVANSKVVTPVVTPKVDADGYPVYDD